MRDRFPTLDDDVNDVNLIEELVIVARSAAQVDEGGVILDITRAVERLGAIVLPLESERGRHLGMLRQVAEIPVMRVGRPDADLPGDRQRSTVAHGLGHLLLHSGCPPPTDSGESRRVERRAHRFASAFLMPGDSILKDPEEGCPGKGHSFKSDEAEGPLERRVKVVGGSFQLVGRRR
ncbi:ImmA/IrrE family metallo-endopeptidase [Demequina aurantiaca]|uniref:ImmA/IrrE family metallo-endopeptidase n=1 Tax=Demequina aurantiaca TaxID=676200 RepID=UPI003F7071A4